jgi:uncharacterized protein YutE (UPF0331/DUF86 family)
LDNNLKEKIMHEISRIDNLFDNGKPLLDLCRSKEPDFIESSAAALLLHSFYNGIESTVLMILKNIGEDIPQSPQWHKELFEKTFEATEKRTMIFRKEYKEQLVEYLTFRHFIRHTYGTDIDWKRLKPLIDHAEEVWKLIKKDMRQFVEDN